MKHEIMKSDDDRHRFIKGIFQETFLKFINDNAEELRSKKRKIIHLDADLFSSTLFILSQVYPYLKKGDILIFDEFSVANHEFFAAEIFQKCFYIKLEPISAINNFYQVIFRIG
jgi:O-methyltransferase